MPKKATKPERRAAIAECKPIAAPEPTRHKPERQVLMKAPEAIEESATDADSEPTSDMPPLAPMLTVDEAAKLLCINRWTLYRLCNNGEFPCLRVGKSIRINPADIRTSLSGHP